jgi:membrane protease YdiL (CAAX protease family)
MQPAPLIQPPALQIPVRTVVAIILMVVFTLFVRAVIQLELLARSVDPGFARDLSYLLVSPLFLLTLLPLLRKHRDFWSRILDRRQLTLRLALSAIAVGVSLRIAWWSQLVARIAFGLDHSDDPHAVIGPVFSFTCPAPGVIGLGILVMGLVVPVIEELVSRGAVQSACVPRGRATAILLSATVFTLLHTPTTYSFVFVTGIVLGLQFWNTRTLWAPLIAHASYNTLVQIDWRCLRGAWNPAATDLPAVIPGSIAIIALISAVGCIVWLLRPGNAGAQEAPRQT